ncbi:MAG TPA: hypothetical protein VNX26_00075 [Candidatus Acidoferrum sp.]|jgi:hypothetical protein|nr:hypothetical protein [Candidatus Acidoferrum sp.]
MRAKTLTTGDTEEHGVRLFGLTNRGNMKQGIGADDDNVPERMGIGMVWFILESGG